MLSKILNGLGASRTKRGFDHSHVRSSDTWATSTGDKEWSDVVARIFFTSSCAGPCRERSKEYDCPPWLPFVCTSCKAAFPVGGSFSARVPRSSAELHRGFVHHILEDEVDGQKEEQGDQREDEEEEVNGDVESIRETHNNAHEP